ncbi:TlpA family protein disulfide reductase [Chitinophaga sp. 22620]|uniref:TlpA family protein disulfide reductase n=1 Tax=Chitinophaga sp. 22620 TaxID=3453952 RepID=UPI003F82D8BA
MKKILFLTGTLILIAVVSYSQLVSDVKRRPIKIGDTIPDIIFRNVVNYNKKELRLTDFKGELIVIDIWNRWCTTCIAGFPKNERMQDKYKGKLQFLLLTSNTPEEFNALKNRSTIVRNTRLPYILSDTLVNNLFPHLGVPHHIWIDSNFVVKAVTNETSEAHLDDYFKTGSTRSVRVRDNDLMDFNDRVPLLSEGKGRLQKYIQSYSLFMSSIPDYPFTDPMGYYTDTLGMRITNRVRFINASLTDLLQFAFGTPNARFDFPGGDKYQENKGAEDSNEFIKKYTYCYELLLPPNYRDSLPEVNARAIRAKMKNDIASNFGFKFSVKDVEYDCLELLSTGPLKTERKKSEKTPLSENIGSRWRFLYWDLTVLAESLREILQSDMLIIDKTGIRGKVDLELKIETRDLPTLNRELNKYNLKLSPGKIILPTTIVTQ